LYYQRCRDQVSSIITCLLNHSIPFFLVLSTLSGPGEINHNLPCLALPCLALEGCVDNARYRPPIPSHVFAYVRHLIRVQHVCRQAHQSVVINA
jgi:hypothetical protein